MTIDAPTTLVAILAAGATYRVCERHPEIAVAAILVLSLAVAVLVALMSSGGHIPV